MRPWPRVPASGGPARNELFRFGKQGGPATTPWVQLAHPAAGLTFRPLAVTAADTLAWHKTRPQEAQDQLRIGIDADREREVLAAWRAASA